MTGHAACPQHRKYGGYSPIVDATVRRVGPAVLLQRHGSTHRLTGAGIVGPSAGELIAELGLGIEMGADAADTGLTIHAHPTLSETVGMAAGAFEGTLTDL